MPLKSQIAEELKDAMRAKDSTRLSTLRLINAAIKDREIAQRGTADQDAGDSGLGEADILGILGKMVKQRHESARAYDEGGRIELAEKERQEIAVIERFLPRKLSEDEVAEAIDAAIAEAGATSIRDMGAVIGALKSKYTGQMDFGTVGPMVKARLG